MKNFIELEAKLKAVPVAVINDLKKQMSETECTMYAGNSPVAYIRKHEDCPTDLFFKCLDHINGTVFAEKR